ncbi:DUF692 domain-containing protein [Planosporangium thailandense]|uniref:DUF692 domain-containing protein n=1 Tax=Planosporangium thailandense TaxID=765197 RepID=A0ABX0Y6R5_9ACTN|nr:DUF692 family multinuclear iron-containing protein [Planosporangium thailandense]NJC73107.1 DUF692 domain-containing protein [Planosporangium thailandense]
MEYLALEPGGPPLVGLANGPVVEPFLARHDRLLDYVEVSFEQLRHNPVAAQLQEQIPVLLHCSSMSVAGFVPPTDQTLEAIAEHVDRTRTPWIGEHLAFISADALGGDDAVGPTELTYTVCPQLSEETVERVVVNLSCLRTRFSVPIILENSPQYLALPGSTMTMAAFVAQVAQRCDVDLLLDVTHFLITANNMGLDPIASVHELPLERVVEVHLSGMSQQSGRWWDDHAAPVPDAVFDLLRQIRRRIRPKAVTFEYNWAPSMPESVIVDQIIFTRDLLAV